MGKSEERGRRSEYRGSEGWKNEMSASSGECGERGKGLGKGRGSNRRIVK